MLCQKRYMKRQKNAITISAHPITCISAILVTMFEAHLNICNKSMKTRILQGNFVINKSCFFYSKKLIMSTMQTPFIDAMPITIDFSTHK